MFKPEYETKLFSDSSHANGWYHYSTLNGQTYSLKHFASGKRAILPAVSKICNDAVNSAACIPKLPAHKFACT